MEISSQLNYWKLWEEEKRMVYGALVNGKTRKGKRRKSGRGLLEEMDHLRLDIGGEENETRKDKNDTREREGHWIESFVRRREGKWVMSERIENHGMKWQRERLEVINDCTNPSYSSLQSVSSHDLPFIWNSREMEVKSREPCNLQ